MREFRVATKSIHLWCGRNKLLRSRGRFLFTLITPPHNNYLYRFSPHYFLIKSLRSFRSCGPFRSQVNYLQNKIQAWASILIDMVGSKIVYLFSFIKLHDILVSQTAALRKTLQRKDQQLQLFEQSVSNARYFLLHLHQFTRLTSRDACVCYKIQFKSD